MHITSDKICNHMLAKIEVIEIALKEIDVIAKEAKQPIDTTAMFSTVSDLASTIENLAGYSKEA